MIFSLSKIRQIKDFFFPNWPPAVARFARKKGQNMDFWNSVYDAIETWLFLQSLIKC